jgi:hypothetical protein
VNNKATSLTDTTKNFQGLSVTVGQTVRITAKGCSGTITSISTTTNPNDTLNVSGGFSGGTAQDVDNGDAYTVHKSGNAAQVGGAAALTGGLQGVAWIEQGVPTVVGKTYVLTFDVLDSAISMRLGSTSKGSDLSSENSYSPDVEPETTFTATTTTTYVQFRNNQNTTGRVDKVKLSLVGVDGWRATDDNKYVKVNNGLVKITGITDAQRATGEVMQALESEAVASAGAWTLNSAIWSASQGYPGHITFFEQRLWLGGSTNFPQTVWGSVTGDFENFTAGALADNALEFTIASTTLNPLRWMVPTRTLLLGTASGEFRLSGAGDGAITPSSFQLRSESTYGSGNVHPVRVGNAVLFVQRMGSKVRSLAYNSDADSYLAPDLSQIASHLLETATIVEMAYQPEPTSCVWAVRSDGVLLGLTYDPLEQVIGWHRHMTSGQFESVVTIPHHAANAHQVWCVVKRTVGGSQVRMIEYLDEALYVDSGLTYSGSVVSTLTGLSHLAEQTVEVLGDGAVFPDEAVSVGGTVTLPHAVSGAQMGLGFDSTMTLLRPEAQVAGTIQQAQKRFGEVTLRLYQTIGITVQGKQMPFRDTDDRMGEGLATFTGDRKDILLGWDRDARITIQQTQPLPCTVLGVIGTLVVGD